MAYCVRCGVDLGERTRECPLCHTPVLLPEMGQEPELDESLPLYPDREMRKVRHRPNLVPSRPVVLLTTFLLLIPFLITLIVDLKGNGRVTWSFYPMTSLALFWIMVAYPAFLRRHTLRAAFTSDVLATAAFLVSLDFYADRVPGWSWYPASALVLVWLCGMLPIWLARAPVVMALAYFTVLSGFLRLMEFLTGSGPWFLPLAMPLAGSACVAGLGIWIALRKVKGRFAAAALIALLLTVLMVATDLCVGHYLTGSFIPAWSHVAAAVGLPLSALLLATHRSPEMRAFLQKKFHF